MGKDGENKCEALAYLSRNFMLRDQGIFVRKETQLGTKITVFSKLLELPQGMETVYVLRHSCQN